MVSMGKNFHVDCFRCEVSDSDREATSQQLQKSVVRLYYCYSKDVCCQQKLHNIYILHYNCNSPIAFYILRFESWLYSFICGDKPT